MSSHFNSFQYETYDFKLNFKSTLNLFLNNIIYNSYIILNLILKRLRLGHAVLREQQGDAALLGARLGAEDHGGRRHVLRGAPELQHHEGQGPEVFAEQHTPFNEVQVVLRVREVPTSYTYYMH